jgi:hypothetical protein
MNKAEYIVLVTAEALKVGAMPRKEAAEVIGNLLTVISTIDETQDDTLIGLHKMITDKYSKLMSAVTDHKKAAEVTLELITQRKRLTLTQVKANQRMHGLAESTFAIWNLVNAGKIRRTDVGTFELV